jgi:hypothetical protein
MLAGVSTRRFERTREPVGEDVGAAERSARDVGRLDGEQNDHGRVLSDLVDRGLDVEQGVLVILDGGKALRAAVNDVFGAVPVRRCVRHKELDFARLMGGDP